MESYRAYLEVRADDGTTCFVRTKEVLASRDLQKRCIEKRALRHIVAQLKAEGLVVTTTIPEVAAFLNRTDD
jgi:hypothetical protein